MNQWHDVSGGSTLEGVRTNCSPSMQALGPLSRPTLGSNSICMAEQRRTSGTVAEQWLTPSGRHAVPNKWVTTVVDIMDNHTSYRFRPFEMTGNLTTADGAGDERRHLDKLKEPSALMLDGNENEADRA